jgi:hypothetical protein
VAAAATAHLTQPAFWAFAFQCASARALRL